MIKHDKTRAEPEEREYTLQRTGQKCDSIIRRDAQIDTEEDTCDPKVPKA